MTVYHFPRRLTLSRVTYIICTVFMLFYILFDVLDLDGSDFPTTRAPIERNVVMVEVPKVTVNAYLPDTPDIWVNLSILLPTGLEKSLRHFILQMPRLLLLNTPRAHGYRIALPRSSTPDSLPSL
jgi:hypothetical protein